MQRSTMALNQVETIFRERHLVVIDQIGSLIDDRLRQEQLPPECFEGRLEPFVVSVTGLRILMIFLTVLLSNQHRVAGWLEFSLVVLDMALVECLADLKIASSDDSNTLGRHVKKDQYWGINGTWTRGRRSFS